MLEVIVIGGGKDGVCVDEVVVDPQPEACRLGFVGRIGGS